MKLKTHPPKILGISIACLALLGGFALPIPEAWSKRAHPERHYQQQWCEDSGGIMEYRLDDGTRVDCLTATHAVEVDWANKWAEGIGQALYYAQKTGRRPGVLLIIRQGDERFIDRFSRAAKGLSIKLWIIRE